jgi:hypothetical protein
MNHVVSFFRAIGLFWSITILTIVTVAPVIVGLTAGGYLFAHNVVAPISKSLNEQGKNNDYQVNQHSQQYQQTYLQQTDKAWEQLAVDKYDIAQAKASGDTTGQQDAYAAAQSDIKSFCRYGQELTPDTQGTLGPQELTFYDTHC